MSGREKMMPIRPSSRAYQFVCLFSWLNTHVWQPTFILPISKVFKYKTFNYLLTFHILGGNSAELIIKLFPTDFLTHPVNGI